MPSAFILCDISKIEETASKAERAAAVLGFIGFECVLLGKELCDEERSSNMETQIGTIDGRMADFADSASERLSKDTVSGDIIVTTEVWHTHVFKGLLALDGKFANRPVVELWVDYLFPFSKYRIFSSSFAMGYAAALIEDPDPTGDWIVAKPYYPVVDGAPLLTIHEVTDANPFSTNHIALMGRGVPVVARDWGAWHETVVHGVTGALYRTMPGREAACEIALKLPSKPIIQHVADNYNVEVAATQIAGFLEKLSNA